MFIQSVHKPFAKREQALTFTRRGMNRDGVIKVFLRRCKRMTRERNNHTELNAHLPPILIATPKPCVISSLPRPMICKPTTRSSSPTTMSLCTDGSFSCSSSMLKYRARKEDLSVANCELAHNETIYGTLTDLHRISVLLASLGFGQAHSADRRMPASTSGIRNFN